ncbi:hypothetical protein [Halococcus thailandensis]|uniref:Uncharacterized protein n=1 Tax=Halococcus thailandensis JCM 13552 TaxID=1227457 RepID=M0NG30_9EURY|nr:hypothetical protein [Halococcus thailandensis]EMA56816.1 hypothetical protein C451_00380 [Halococcus thailandensis JCM 13552]
MTGSDSSEQEYPDELLDAHRIEDSRLFVPMEKVMEGLEELLFEMGTFEETGNPHNLSRMREYGDFIRTMDQEDLYEEMKSHPNSTVSSSAKHIDPEYKPRTESTFEQLQYVTQEIAPNPSV